jgi:hypothetical protein
MRSVNVRVFGRGGGWGRRETVVAIVVMEVALAMAVMIVVMVLAVVNCGGGGERWQQIQCLDPTSLMSLKSPACLMPSTRTDDSLCNSSRKRAEMTSEILCTTTESSGVDAGGRALPGPEAAS